MIYFPEFQGYYKSAFLRDDLHEFLWLCDDLDQILSKFHDHLTVIKNQPFFVMLYFEVVLLRSL